MAEVPEGFGARLRFALKTLNMSPAALGAAVAVDKSVVSRWLSGKNAPSGHNLSRIGEEIARRRPQFSMLAFDAPPEAFLAALGIGPLPPAALGVTGPAATASAANALPIPFNLLDDARHEVARRGVEYFARYNMHYWSFSRPGKIVRMHMMMRPQDGLIEVRYGARGFEFRGWALLLLNRLYIQLAEERFEAMAFIVTNAGQQPRARLIRGLLLGPSEGLLVPTVSPIVLSRTADLSGDADRDARDYEAAKDFDPLAEGAAVPDAIRRLLGEECLAPRGSDGGPVQLRTIYETPPDPPA